MTIAALFVDEDGIYAGREGVDLWPESRDARTYAGPHSAVAHPPCQRWGRWWWAMGDDRPGNDGGCFESALRNVERVGGVIEHPAYSHAWGRFGIVEPAPEGGWSRGLFRPGWSCQVAQRRYGHRARKQTWLYYVGPNPPELLWGDGDPPAAYLCAPGRTKTNPGRTDVEIMGDREARATPPEFADLLLSLARGAACASP